MHEAMHFRIRSAPAPRTAGARTARAFAITTITLKPSELESPRVHENNYGSPEMTEVRHGDGRESFPRSSGCGWRNCIGRAALTNVSDSRKQTQEFKALRLYVCSRRSIRFVYKRNHWGPLGTTPNQHYFQCALLNPGIIEWIWSPVTLSNP